LIKFSNIIVEVLQDDNFFKISLKDSILLAILSDTGVKTKEFVYISNKIINEDGLKEA
jgi:hypothetical protein